MAKSRHYKTGKQLRDGTVVTKEAPGGLQQMRCPKCHNLSSPFRRDDGIVVSRCAKGHEFRVTKM